MRLAAEIARRTEPGIPGRPGRPRRWARLSTGCEPATPSADQVAGPTTPSAVRPWARWKRRTARAVPGPKTPSAATPRRAWSSRTLAPRVRTPPPPAPGAGSRRVAVQAAADHPPRARAHDAVRRQPVPALEALDGVQGAAPEDAVVAEVQRALELGHGASAIAVVQRGEGLRAGHGQQRDGHRHGQAAYVGGSVGHRLSAYGVS